MKRITISMNDELACAARGAAAKAGKSLSRYIAELLRKQVKLDQSGRGGSGRNGQLAALERFLSGPLLHIAIDGKMPTAEERNVR